jgi:crotonobetainyl-CoA:carnitine CoA-transferase CaiB-like acyl-CoA transferase
MPDQPLDGIRVVEFTWVIAGPLLTKYLALLGAEVIRIESAKRAEFRDRGSTYALLNNNKQSCCLDLAQPRAREIAREIVRRSDVVVENFGAGVIDRLDLGYADLRAVRPDLVMLSCSGLGRTGPEKDLLAYGTLLQLFSGWSLLQGQPDTDEIVIGGAWTDPLAAVTGAFAVLAALHHRARTGEGQYVDLSMAEATLCGIPEALLDYSLNQRLGSRLGNADAIDAPHGCYPCQGDDQWVALSAAGEEEWPGLCRALGDPPWTHADRFADAFRRKRNEAELNALIAQWTSARSREETVRTLQAYGVPAGPSANGTDLLSDPHLRERGMFVPIDSPTGQPHQTIGAPWRIEPGLTPVYAPAPRLGQDNVDVLKTLLGLDDAAIAELTEAKVIY